MGSLTGFAELDRKLDGGLKEGYLYIVGGRPGMGKTGFAMSMLEHICVKQGRTAAFFSMGMVRRHIVDRMLAIESGVALSKIQKWDLNDTEWDELIVGEKAYKSARLLVSDATSFSLKDICLKCAAYKEVNKDFSVVVIDYLQLIDVYVDRRVAQERYSKVIKALKTMAEEMHISVVVLSQLSRECEYSADCRPVLSLWMEKQADAVLLLYRKGYYHDSPENRNHAEVIIARNRDGFPGTIELRYDPETVSFENFITEPDS